jgi:hypothetical protein
MRGDDLLKAQYLASKGVTKCPDGMTIDIEQKEFKKRKNEIIAKHQGTEHFRSGPTARRLGARHHVSSHDLNSWTEEQAARKEGVLLNPNKKQ